MAERPTTKPLTPEQILALPDGARVLIARPKDANADVVVIGLCEMQLLSNFAHRGLMATWLAEGDE